MKKKVASKRNNKTKNPESHRIIKKFIALALLPADKIRDQFKTLKLELLKADSKKWLPFINYYERTWLNGYTPEVFSVFGAKVRTNNAIEAYHRVLNGYLSSSLTASGFVKDLFYLKETLLSIAWTKYRNNEYTIDDLYEVVTDLVGPNVENLEHTVIELYTGMLVF